MEYNADAGLLAEGRPRLRDVITTRSINPLGYPGHELRLPTDIVSSHRSIQRPFDGVE